MNHSGVCVAQPAEDFHDERSVVYRPSDPDLISDDEIDFHAMARNTRPDMPGGRIVFSTADYATEEEAMAAMDALFMNDTEDDADELSATA